MDHIFMGPADGQFSSPEMSISNCQFTLPNVPDERHRHSQLREAWTDAQMLVLYPTQLDTLSLRLTSDYADHFSFLEH